MNSTPSSLARIMRLTALHPPPPTPMTLIFAGCSSSLKLMRIPASLVVIFPQPSPRWLVALGQGHEAPANMAFNLDTRFPPRCGAERRAFAPYKPGPPRLPIPAAPPAPADHPGLAV